jgi:hypothetical protein
MAPLVIAMIASGCGGYVEIPREQFEAASHDESAIHRVIKQSGEEYLVNHFTLTDTTLVIMSLAPNDRRYQRVVRPIELPLDDIASIQRVENGPPSWTIIAIGVVGVGLFIAAVAWLSGGDAFSD